MNTVVRSNIHRSSYSIIEYIEMHPKWSFIWIYTCHVKKNSIIPKQINNIKVSCTFFPRLYTSRVYYAEIKETSFFSFP